MIRLMLLLTFALALPTNGAARSGFDLPPSTDELVKVTLLSETPAAEPGKPFWLAIELTMKDGWHVNWVNPGDAGLAPSVALQVPDGWRAGPVRWPYPTRYDITEMSIYGYGGVTRLLVEITPAPELVGRHSEISATVEWLACAEACVPGQSTAKVVIRHEPADTIRPSTPQNATFEEARRRLPVKDEQWRFMASVAGDRINIIAVAPMGAGNLSKVVFFPYDADVIEHSAEQVLVRESGNYLLVVERSRMNPDEPTRIRGVLVSETGWGGKHKAIAVNVPVR